MMAVDKVGGWARRWGGGGGVSSQNADGEGAHPVSTALFPRSGWPASGHPLGPGDSHICGPHPGAVASDSRDQNAVYRGEYNIKVFPYYY